MQVSGNYIDTISPNQVTPLTRLDAGNTDNNIRHLFTYVDNAGGDSASRCNYCCWGCAGWREVLVWAARPPPSA